MFISWAFYSLRITEETSLNSKKRMQTFSGGSHTLTNSRTEIWSVANQTTVWTTEVTISTNTNPYLSHALNRSPSYALTGKYNFENRQTNLQNVKK